MGVDNEQSSERQLLLTSEQYRLKFLYFVTSTYTKGNSENSVLGSGKLGKGLNSSFCSSLNRKVWHLWTSCWLKGTLRAQCVSFQTYFVVLDLEKFEIMILAAVPTCLWHCGREKQARFLYLVYWVLECFRNKGVWTAWNVICTPSTNA